MQEARNKIAALIRRKDRIYRSVVDVYCNTMVEDCPYVVCDRSSFGGVIDKVQSAACISAIMQQQQV
jgi:hypothetical protein